jgi:hypothetical protein
MGPIRDAPDVSVLYRVKVDVIDMATEIGVIATGVLPVTALPDTLISS